MSSKAQNSVLKKDPMKLIEVPDKKIIAVNEDNSLHSKITENQKMVKEDDKDMDITMNDDIPPNNQT